MKSDFTMDWMEYANYIKEKTGLTRNQAFAVSGKLYNISDEKVADHINSTATSVSTQRNRLDYSGLDKKEKKLFFQPHVPASPARIIGEISYYNTDSWPQDGTTGDVVIYATVKDKDDFIIVVEEYKTDYEDDLDGLFAKYKFNRNVTIYENYNSFIERSPHNPQDLDTQDSYNLVTKGLIFRSASHE